MRTIKKRKAPKKLVQWRQLRIAKSDAVRYPFDYDALRNEDGLAEVVEKALSREQGEICAYTGRRISVQLKPKYCAWFHIEHLKGQSRCRAEALIGQCESGFDTHYKNMVACWPEPNREEATAYGAVLKNEWPETPEADLLFVSPLLEGCAARFKFSRQGQISAARSDDAAAKATIRKLGLDDEELDALRLNAIRGAFAPNDRPLTFVQLEKLRKVMDDDEDALNSGANIRLRAYCFAIRPNIDREISKLKGIADNKKRGAKKPKKSIRK